MTQAWLGTYNVVWTTAGLPEEKDRGASRRKHIQKKGKNESKREKWEKDGAGTERRSWFDRGRLRESVNGAVEVDGWWKVGGWTRSEEGRLRIESNIRAGRETGWRHSKRKRVLKKTTETRWQAKYGRFVKLLRWAVSCGEMPGPERDHPARQYN